MTAERIEPLLTKKHEVRADQLAEQSERSGAEFAELAELVELCRSRGVLLVSDEIYDAFTYDEALEDGRFPTPARMTQDMLLIRGFRQDVWLHGLAAGLCGWAAPLIQQMAKLQQYTFVCAPSMAQVGMAGAFDVLIFRSGRPQYQKRRDMVVEAFSDVTELVAPSGAFYAFVKVPARWA
jgi:aspartate/methionine/tyrosine aminotransferase